MLVCLLALAACLADDEVPSPEPAQEQVAELERILFALEKVHPRIVAEVEHEVSEEVCHMALVTPQTATPQEVAECFNMVDQHSEQWGTVNMADNNVMIMTLGAQFSREIKAQPASYWDDVLDTGRDAYHQGRAESAVLRREFDAEAQPPEVTVEMDSSDSGGMGPAPLP